MGYAARAGFGAGFWQLVQTAAGKQTATKTAPAPTAPITTDMPHIAVPPPPGTSEVIPAQPILPILVAGPAPLPSGGGGGSGVDVGLAPATGTGLSKLLQQPAVLVGLAILGFLALRRGGGTRKF